MENKLPARPNLEHLRHQAKALLADLSKGRRLAADTFIEHLPSAHGMTPAQVHNAGFRLADAQSAIARKMGFSHWTGLVRHVGELRALEGVWEFISLEADGVAMSATSLSGSRLLIDGDRFRMESPLADYDGIFNIDADVQPHLIDIEFVGGPEGGNRSFGIFELQEEMLRICLTVSGTTRPREFATNPGSGHVLEVLRRSARDRPAGVDGGTPQPVAEAAAADPAEFDIPMTPLLQRLEGEWEPVEVVINGRSLPQSMLSSGLRTASGNEMKVIFNGQTVVHAKMRCDESITPIAVDYLNLGGSSGGTISLGILEWIGEEFRSCMAQPGASRPEDFFCEAGSGRTLSRWRRRE